MSALPALVLALVTAQNAPEPVYVDFRGGRFDDGLLNRVRLKDMHKSEADGLHIRLPAGHKGQWVGVGSKVVPPGDFEITLSYRINKIEKPDKGYGAGVNLWVMVQNAEADAATIGRIMHPDGREAYTTDNGYDKGGQRAHDIQQFHTRATAGKLRLVREGTALKFLVAEDGNDEFKLLRAIPDFGADPVKLVQMRADPGTAQTAMDVTFVDFRLSSSVLASRPGEAVPALAAHSGDPVYETAVPPSRGWWMAAAGCLVLLACVGGMVLYARSRRNRDSEDQEGGEEDEEGDGDE